MRVWPALPFEALYGHLLLSGNAFVNPLMLGSRLAELHLLRPDRCRVLEGRDGWEEAVEYRVGANVRRYSLDAAPLPLLHLRLFHPLDDHSGFAPVEAAHRALDLHNAAASWNKALLDNSARPSGALVYQPKEGGNLSGDQYQRLKDELEDGYSGAARAGRPMLLEGGLDWKAMGLSPRDMDFVEAKNGASRAYRTRLRGPADAAWHSGRQYFCQLCRSQPRLLPAHGFTASVADCRGTLRLAETGLWRGSAAHS